MHTATNAAANIAAKAAANIAASAAAKPRSHDIRETTDVAALAARVRQFIQRGSVDPFSAVSIVRAALELGASIDTAEDVIAEVAKGPDGIGGTADDLIPMSTLAKLSTLLHTGLVRDMAQWAVGQFTEPPSGGKPVSRWCCWKA